MDHLVTFKLISFAYLQIGVIQAVAGFYCWLTVMSDYGYPPHILPQLGMPQHDNWQKQTLYCQVKHPLETTHLFYKFTHLYNAYV